MSVNKETIKSLSQLCRIHCSDEEEDSYAKDFQGILSYFEKLQEVDTEDLPPLNHVLSGIVNVEREDIPENTLTTKKFLENSPSHTGGMIRVPPVIKGL